MTESERPVVLVVEEDPETAGTYEAWLADDYEVRRAPDGETALAQIDDDVDVVVLDRTLPDGSAESVLADLRERGADPLVAMVTDSEPGFDVVEAGFDDYVTAPPTRAAFREAVDGLVALEDHADEIREYRSLVARRAALEEGLDESVLADSEAFADLQARIAAAERELDVADERLLDDATFVGELRELTGDEQAPVGDGPPPEGAGDGDPAGPPDDGTPGDDETAGDDGGTGDDETAGDDRERNGGGS